MAHLSKKQDFSLYAQRRKQLIAAVVKQYPGAQGAIVLFGGFEQERIVFRQESSFYYYAGLQEPGLVMVLELTGKMILCVPNNAALKAQWMHQAVSLEPDNAAQVAFDEIKMLGSQCAGYQFHPFFARAEYADLLQYIDTLMQRGNTLFTLNPATPFGYIEQRLILKHLAEFMPTIAGHMQDISSIVASQRRVKDIHEIDLLYKAVDVTLDAQEAAARAITDGALECEVQAGLEYMMIGSGARTAFPSIVASGKNSTVLHYHANNCVMRNGDLVVVDIGAELGMYAADITRTYPVSGTFTQRQRELYDIVLETQQYIADVAKPGLWLSNKEKPEQSLNHLARKFLQKHGYDQYFPHGIGHFLGLDVHDVGDGTQPLQPGDIITIEPGIYIPAEGIGIRIEDDYWVVEDGVVCLSEGLSKDARDIERMVQQSFENSQGGCCEGELGEGECCDDETDVQH